MTTVQGGTGAGPVAPLPEGLEGSVDAPVEGEVLRRGPVTVGGWHAWRGRPVLAVVVAGGGAVAVTPAGSHRRDDVGRHFGDRAMAACGWRTVLDVGAHAGDHVRIDVAVWPEPGTDPVVVASLQAALEDPPSPLPGGSLDTGAVDGALRPGVVVLHGWALHPTEPVERVEVSVDGGPSLRARIGLPRPDLSDRFDLPQAAICGFERAVRLGGRSRRRAVVDVTAFTAAGAFSLERRTYQLAPAPAPAAAPSNAPARAPTRRRREATPVPAAPIAGGGSPSLDTLSLAVFTHDLRTAGAQRWLRELLDTMGAGRAFPCSVYSPTPGPLAEPLETLGVDVVVTGGAPLDDVRTFRGAVAAQAAQVRLAGHNAALANTYDAFAGATAARLAGLPYLWCIHESTAPDEFWSVRWPTGGVDPAVPGVVADTFAAASGRGFVADATRDLYPGADDGRSLVLPLSFDLAAVERSTAGLERGTARSALGLPADARVLLAMGTVEPRKCQNVLVQAFAAVHDRFDDASLCVVGDIGEPYGEALRRYAGDMGLGEAVRVVPMVDEPWPWYRAADALVLASDVESLPRSILEAMAFGLPVCAAAVFGVPELLADGQSAILFEPDDVAAATRALGRLLSLTPGARRKLGAAGSAVLRARAGGPTLAEVVGRVVRGLAAGQALTEIVPASAS